VIRVAVLLLAVAMSQLATAAAQAPQAVQIDMAEFVFRPALVRLTAGRPVRLTLVNRGQIAHQFATDYLHDTPARVWAPPLTVEARGVDAVLVAPGGTAALEFLPVRRGRFTFACTIEGHREAGMRGVLEVR
jgi:uncharacterized cupredoxin-like copper-binding protein